MSSLSSNHLGCTIIDIFEFPLRFSSLLFSKTNNLTCPAGTSIVNISINNGIGEGHLPLIFNFFSSLAHLPRTSFSLVMGTPFILDRFWTGCPTTDAETTVSISFRFQDFILKFLVTVRFFSNHVNEFPLLNSFQRLTHRQATGTGTISDNSSTNYWNRTASTTWRTKVMVVQFTKWQPRVSIPSAITALHPIFPSVLPRQQTEPLGMTVIPASWKRSMYFPGFPA